MAVFEQTFGISADVLLAYIQWLLTAVAVIFAVYVLKGTYVRWTKGGDDTSGIDVWIESSLAMIILIYIGYLVK